MSILSSTQGTPERVWSLVAALSACGGALDRTDAANLLNPGFIQDGQEVRDDGFNQTLGAATSLGAVEVDNATLRVASSCTANDYSEFCDWVHDRLASLENNQKDAVLFQTYAWVVVESQRQGSLTWIQDWTNDAFADAADNALPDGEDDDGARRINTTKLPPWRRWLAAVGVLVPMPLSIRHHPGADVRAIREINRARMPRGIEMSAEEFLKILTSRLPYLDGGRIYVDAQKRVGFGRTPRQLSPILSDTLRNLHENEAIELRIRGDAGDVFELSKHTLHEIQSFHAVVVKEGGAS